MSTIDDTIASIGLPSHPTPKAIADQLKALAKLLEHDGRMAIVAAGQLSARGFPSGTLGDGTGSRSSSSTTSVERAAGADGGAPGPFAGSDRRLATLLQLLWKATGETQTLMTSLLAHAQDLDPIPVGRGECQCCGKFCDPAKDQHDRLRSGFCNACRVAWDRAGRPDHRSDWIHARRHTLFDGRDGTCELCKRPWTERRQGGMTTDEALAGAEQAGEMLRTMGDQGP